MKHGPNVNPVFDLCAMVLNTATPLQLLEAKGFCLLKNEAKESLHVRMFQAVQQHCCPAKQAVAVKG